MLSKNGKDNTIQDKGLAVLHQLSQSALNGYLEHLLRLMVNLTAEFVDCDICSIMLMDADEKVLTVQATQSLDSEYLEERPLSLDDSLAGQALKAKKSLQWEDVTQEPDFKYLPMAKRLGLRSLLTIPMLLGERPLGVINFYTTEVRHFTPGEIQFLEAIANQMALAIKRTELEDETKKMEKALEARKIVERAKGILMQKKGLTEQQAHKLLRKTSMDARKSMEDVAQAILLTEGI